MITKTSHKVYIIQVKNDGLLLVDYHPHLTTTPSLFGKDGCRIFEHRKEAESVLALIKEAGHSASILTMDIKVRR